MYTCTVLTYTYFFAVDIRVGDFVHGAYTQCETHITYKFAIVQASISVILTVGYITTTYITKWSYLPSQPSFL